MGKPIEPEGPRTYTGFGVEFSYPSNWTLREEQTDGWPVSLAVESPAAAFWSLTIHRRLLPPAAVAEEVLQAMRTEYSDLECEASRRQILDLDSYHYDLRFYCMDFVVAACVQVIAAGDLVLVVLSQGEDREFAAQQGVFAAMTHSLVTSVAT